MDVTTDGHGWVNALHVALLDEDLAGLGAQLLDLAFLDDLTALELFNLPTRTDIRRGYISGRCTSVCRTMSKKESHIQRDMA